MICLDTNMAQLLTLKFWSARADVLMMFIATIALIFTVFQVVISRRESRRSTAYSAYQEYIKLCLEHSDLSFGDKSSIIQQNGRVNSKYPWFVAQMLFTFEQVLQTNKMDKEWEVAIRSQLERHQWYLKKSKSVKRDEWVPSLRKILDEIVAP